MAKTGAVFVCSMPFTSYVFKSGNRIQFSPDRYYTEDADEIKELRAEAEDPRNIFISEDKSETAKDYMNPMAALRARIIAEYEETRAQGVFSATHEVVAAEGEANKPTVLGSITSTADAVTARAINIPAK